MLLNSSRMHGDTPTPRTIRLSSNPTQLQSLLVLEGMKRREREREEGRERRRER